MGQGPPSFLFSGYQVVFHWGEKQPLHEVQHPFAPHAQVKSEWSYTPCPPICLHVANRDNFITELCDVTVLINNVLFHTPTMSPLHTYRVTKQFSISHPTPTNHQSVTSLPATSPFHHHCHWLFIPVILTSLLVQQCVSDSLILKMKVDMV